MRNGADSLLVKENLKSWTTSITCATSRRTKKVRQVTNKIAKKPYTVRRVDARVTPHTNGAMLTFRQLMAARALVDWTREVLAEKSGTSAQAIKNFETRGSDPKRSTLIAWRSALAAEGVEFHDATDTEGPGVRLRLDVHRDIEKRDDKRQIGAKKGRR